jgi:hypothetical protein
MVLHGVLLEMIKLLEVFIIDGFVILTGEIEVDAGPSNPFIDATYNLIVHQFGLQKWMR